MGPSGKPHSPPRGGGLSSLDPEWDVVVVGAGPAGAMTALEISRRGRKTLLLERLTFPRWKVCGATLSPGVRQILSEAGLGGVLPSCGALTLHTLRLGGWSLRADLPLNGSVALSRSAFDVALVEAAVREGCTFLSSVSVRLGALLDTHRGLRVRAGQEEREISARGVVAADGLNSGIMSQAGLPSRTSPSGGRPMVGLGGVVSSPPSRLESGVIHMAVGEGGYVGMVRVEDGSLNVAAALSAQALKGAGSPEALVAAILQEGEWPQLPSPDVGWRGTPELTRRPRLPGAERLLAVGDASGYVEPFTGEGMFWALSGARALAPLADRGAGSWHAHLVSEWAAVHRRRIGRAQRLCRLMAWTLSKPFLSRSLLRVLRDHPRVAAPVVRRVGVPLASEG